MEESRCAQSHWDATAQKGTEDILKERNMRENNFFSNDISRNKQRHRHCFSRGFEKNIVEKFSSVVPYSACSVNNKILLVERAQESCRTTFLNYETQKRALKIPLVSLSEIQKQKIEWLMIKNLNTYERKTSCPRNLILHEINKEKVDYD